MCSSEYDCDCDSVCMYVCICVCLYELAHGKQGQHHRNRFTITVCVIRCVVFVVVFDWFLHVRDATIWTRWWRWVMVMMMMQKKTKLMHQPHIIQHIDIVIHIFWPHDRIKHLRRKRGKKARRTFYNQNLYIVDTREKENFSKWKKNTVKWSAPHTNLSFYSCSPHLIDKGIMFARRKKTATTKKLWIKWGLRLKCMR